MSDTGSGLVRFVRAAHNPMTRLNISKAREEFPEIVNRAAYGNERTIVSRRGKDLAAVIPMDDLRLLERLAQEEMDRIDIEDARAALKEAEREGDDSTPGPHAGTGGLSPGLPRRSHSRRGEGDPQARSSGPQASEPGHSPSGRESASPGKNYRAIYQIRDEVLMVLVVKVGHRKQVYRRVN